MKDKIRILFVGMGSIGKKHLLNLSAVAEEKNIELEIDILKKNNYLESDIQDKIKNLYLNYEEIKSVYDVCFVVNPTSEHYNSLKELNGVCKHFFIEKPIFDKIDYDVNMLNLKQENIYYVAAPLRYTGVIETLKQIITEEKIYSVRSICSSYLPDWRPGKDYRDIYSAKKELGGGVTIDLIHEWDYLTYLFDFPLECFNIQGKYSHLEINSEDLSIYIARYKDKLIELHLDYFGRTPRREIELFTEKGTIIGDFIKKEVRFSWTEEKMDLKNNEDFYIKEMRYFFDLIYRNKENKNDINHAYKLLRFIKESK